MDKFEKACGLFYDLLEREKIFLSEDIGFRRLCNLMDIDCEGMEDYLMEEFGFSGEQIINSYRRDYSVKLKEKYGIVIDG